MAASSFLLPSFSAVSSSKPQTLSLVLSLSSSKPFCLIKNASLISSSPLPLQRKATILGSGVVPRVAMASELESSSGEEFSPDLKLFVGNLSFSVDSAQLADLFQRAGNVEMVEVIYDKKTGKSRGFGFVTMSTVDEVEVAAQKFNGYILAGRPLRVNSGPPPRRGEFPSKGFRTGGNFEAASSGAAGDFVATHKVYVGNLSWGVDNLALATLFGEQGKVLDARVVYDRESGRSRGFGFVTYGSAEEVDNAIASLDGTDFDGRSIRVTVAEPKPRHQF
ncbi:29 kDa ribonucleoprotein A, chloroplastic [Canna indica]|uniref:29 kDa ribonucleoprotein A, chloroplastic n=1 Tax=Canna indica TaxID=4628 RepID=A0AAQ3K8M7_9LILI|nr:29 kDa ribonucleoprotein A, chloroplastic [Canna indica]